MGNFRWSQRSLTNLSGVHPDLVAVCHRALEITTQDMVVIEGLRSVERQRQLVAQGKSQTMNSRHLTGHAVDIVPYPITWDWEYFWPIVEAMQTAADELGIDLTSGAYWKNFPDAPHHQLSWESYPL